MKQYIICENRYVISLDTNGEETAKNAKVLHSQWMIDESYIAEEDGILYYDKTAKDIKKGDFILIMYSIGREENKEVIVLRNEDLLNYIIRKSKVEAEENKYHSTCCSCSCNKCCSDCSCDNAKTVD